MITSLFGVLLTLPLWSQFILFVLFIVVGMFGLIKGADAFVSGASGIAKKLKIPTLIIGLTIVSIGTSLPEASVSISSAIKGSADISISNVVGSSLFNLLIVLGISISFVPIVLNKKIIIKDFTLMVASVVLLLIFALFGSNDPTLSRIECIIFFTLFLAYIIYSIIEAKRANNINNDETTGEESQKQNKMGKNLILLFAGLIGIVIGGDFVVFGAQNFAINVGISEVLVGLTIVAIGTSLPELVTSIVAAKKQENDIALGNVIGSNIFNVLFILGMTGIISPLAVSANVIIDIIIMTSIFIAFFIFSLIKQKLPKFLGWIMVALYFIYLAYIILRDFIFAV